MATYARQGMRVIAFARVAPEHKIQLVQALQARRQVVAIWWQASPSRSRWPSRSWSQTPCGAYHVLPMNRSFPVSLLHA